MVEKVALCWVRWSKIVLDLLRSVVESVLVLKVFSIMGLDSHSTLLMVRPIHRGLRTSCPSRLMAALVCLTVDAWLPYPRKHGFSINLDEPLVVIAAQSNVIQREGHELMFFGPDSPRLTDRSRLVFKSNSGGNRNDRSGVFLSPSSHNWLSCFVLDSGEAVHFLPQPGTNSVIGRNAGVHIPMIFWFIGSWKG